MWYHSEMSWFLRCWFLVLILNLVSDWKFEILMPDQLESFVVVRVENKTKGSELFAHFFYRRRRQRMLSPTPASINDHYLSEAAFQVFFWENSVVSFFIHLCKYRSKCKCLEIAVLKTNRIFAHATFIRIVHNSLKIIFRWMEPKSVRILSNG